MLFKNLFQHAIKTRHTSANVGGVKLEWQDGIVPCDLGADAHGLSLHVRGWHTAPI